MHQVITSRGVILELVRNDFRARYLGSYLGILWAFIHPLVTTFLLWFIFEVGFKTGAVTGYPFALWLMCALAPWYFFSDGLANATNSVTDNSYLVKKVLFRVSILPLVKILSSLIVHLFFIILLLALLAWNGFVPSIHAIQILPLTALLALFVLGLSWLTSALVVFVKDLGQLIQMLLQFGFWLTPIFWLIDVIPEKYQWYLKLNPMFFVVEGYRDALLRNRWVWEQGSEFPFFLCAVLCSLALGGIVFMRLRPHFADVL